jgi:2-polyprenyl-3-methyl-5-hydroxy-6-metoxy-1,4-benzoquinol methylase
MERVLKDAQEALSKSVVSVGWVERSATHQDRDGDRTRLEPNRVGVGEQEHSNGNPLASDGGLHPPYKDAWPDPFYFGYARPEVVALVPETARWVLDIGCGAGRLGEAIKQRQPATVSGIEFDPRAAVAARRRLDQVWAGDVEQLDLKIPPGSFDAIVCADVLEHLREPERLLKQAREWLSPDGCLVAPRRLSAREEGLEHRRRWRGCRTCRWTLRSGVSSP